jgi:hypothetical protein
MYRTISLLVIGAFSLCFTLACGSSAGNQTTPVNAATPAEAPPAQTPVMPTPAKDVAPGFYLGCWTAGDGTHLAITDTTLQTEKTGKPLRYKDISDETAKTKGARLLELEDKDASGQLLKYVSLEPKGEDEMQGRGFETADDFKNNYPKAVYARWGKDECKGVMPLLNRGKR